MKTSPEHEQIGQAMVQQERKRLAHSLHDSVAQSLYALVLAADVAQKALEHHQNDQLSTALEDITLSSLQALKDIRLILFGLSPAALEEISLLDAMELRLNTVERRAGMQARLECPQDLKISWEMKAELYYLICEVLNNSLHHSGARTVYVIIHSTAALLSIEMGDDGKGFNLSDSKPGGMGLKIISERARKLGGNLSIHSSAGMGTQVYFHVNLSRR